ncbi:SCO family protein [Hydrogenivirga sp.]
MAPLLVPFLLFFLFSFSREVPVPNAELVLGRDVPNVLLTDMNGRSVRLSDITGGKTVLMSFIYTRCTSSCPLIVQRLREALSEVEFGDYRVLLVDFDERDTQAELKKFVNQRNIYDSRWKVALAKGSELRQLTGALDFKFYYDEKTDMFAHPNVLVVLSPSRKVTGYILGLSYDPDRLTQMLKDAQRDKVALNPIRGLLLKCFRYDPVTGTYFIDWSFVAMVVGGSIPIAIMFYFIVFKPIVSGFRRVPG